MALCIALTGCSPAATNGTPSQSQTPSVSVSTPAVDFTAPGDGVAIIRKLIDAAGGNGKPIMVQVSRTEATVAMLVGSQVQAWGFRGGTIKQVPTDITNVEQATFDINDFNLADVGALFRTAASVSGSDSQQTLQIVDYSAGEVLMSVSTNPESRTVFFRADGSLVSTLDFHTKSGIEEGLTDAIGAKRQVIRVGIQSDGGAFVDYVGPNNTTMRRQRPARFPASTAARSDAPSLPEFEPSVVDSAVIWQVLTELRAKDEFNGQTLWSVSIEDRDKTGEPKMYFTVGGTSFVRTLKGETTSG